MRQESSAMVLPHGHRGPYAKCKVKKRLLDIRTSQKNIRSENQEHLRDFVQVQVQISLSKQIMSGLCDAIVSFTRNYGFVDELAIARGNRLFLRTGYTDEDVFEQYCTPLGMSWISGLRSSMREDRRDSSPCGLGRL